MPLVRIDLPSSWSADDGVAIGDTVYDVLVGTLDVPAHDRFQVISRHDGLGLSIDPHYLDIDRGPDAMIIQITLNVGRSADLKKLFFATLVEALRAKLAIRPEDVFVSLVETKRENWSFGKGVAQYAD